MTRPCALLPRFTSRLEQKVNCMHNFSATCKRAETGLEATAAGTAAGPGKPQKLSSRRISSGAKKMGRTSMTCWCTCGSGSMVRLLVLVNNTAAAVLLPLPPVSVRPRLV